MSTPPTQDYKPGKTAGIFPGHTAVPFPFFLPKQPPSIPPLMPAPSTFGGPCVHTHGNVPSWSHCFVVDDNGQLLPYEDTSELDIAKKPEESLQEVS
jgi:hypothetical protein